MGYLRKSETIGAAADLVLFLVVVVRAASSDDVASGCYGNDTGHPVCFSAYRDRGIALLSWSDALALCRGTLGGSLPVVSSSGVQLRLAEFLYDNQFTIDSVWLGARGATSSPPMANTDWRWVSGGGGGGGAFPSLDASGSFDRSMAVVSVDVSGNASIGAESTTFTADGYICQSKQQTTCLGDAADDHFGDGVNCFRRFDQPGNWFTSRNRCLYGNGDLATLQNTTTAGLNETLRKLGYVFDSKSDGTKRKYWVGLTKLWWQWAPDSVEYNLTFFIDRPSVENQSVANGNCLAVDFRNQFSWAIRDCSIKFQTVCQTSELPITTQSSSSSSSSSSVTLPVWAVGVIGGCVGLFYVVSLIVVAVIVCKCCRGRRKTTNDRQKERIQQNGYHMEPVRQVTNSIYPPQMPPPDNPSHPRRQPTDEYDDEFDDDYEEGDYENEIPAPTGDQYMNHGQAAAAAALGPRSRPR